MLSIKTGSMVWGHTNVSHPSFCDLFFPPFSSPACVLITVVTNISLQRTTYKSHVDEALLFVLEWQSVLTLN